MKRNNPVWAQIFAIIVAFIVGMIAFMWVVVNNEEERESKTYYNHFQS